MNEHNHPPHCCCPDPGPRTDYRPPTLCPGCLVHGDAVCICGTPGLTYAGPERDYRVHGERS